MRFIYFLFVLVMICFGCKSQQKTATTNAAVDADSLFVSLDRSPCFGACPTFKASIYKSGYGIYKGRMAVDRLGTYEAHFTKDQLKMFDEAAVEFAVDTLQSEHVNKYIADFPASYSSIVIKGKRHSFHISTDTPPENLAQFETRVERLLEVVKWKMISDKTD